MVRIFKTRKEAKKFIKLKLGDKDYLMPVFRGPAITKKPGFHIMNKLRKTFI